MAFRFRRSFKVMPGVRINMSKSGFSTTIGGRGASVNIGKRGTYLNTNIPGTGIGSRTKLNGGQSRSSSTYATSTPTAPKIPQPASTRWFSWGVSSCLAFALWMLYTIFVTQRDKGPENTSAGLKAVGIVLFLGFAWWLGRKAHRANQQRRYDTYIHNQAVEQAQYQAAVAAETLRGEELMLEQERQRLATYEPALTKARRLVEDGLLSSEQLAGWERTATDGSISAYWVESAVKSAESTARQALAEAARIKSWRDNITSKYDADTAALLLQRDIQLGMSREQLIDSLGTPTKIEQTLVKDKAREILVYGSKTTGSYFHLLDGKVTKAVVR